MPLKREINWKKPVKNIHYVVVKELPEEIQSKFEIWLTGKQIPIVDKEGANAFNCAYYWDYQDFLNHLEIHK
jgi:hypothetical protein